MFEDEILTGDQAPQEEKSPVGAEIPWNFPATSDELAPQEQDPSEPEEPSAPTEVVTAEEPSEEEPSEPTDEVAEGEPSAEEPTEGEPAEGEMAEETAETPVESVPVPDSHEVPYHERYYLKYRDGKRSTPLDLEGTISFLKEMGFDGGELRQAREGKDCAEGFRSADKNKGNQMYCSYCGSEIAGVEFYRLPDGRLRCTNCSKTLVTTKAEVEELCQRVGDNLDNFFGATIDAPIKIEMVDERKLKKKIGLAIGGQDEQSMLVLGVAINKNKKYSIILENGAPRISLIATFAHELTHIWQYTHWDANKKMPKCHKSKRGMIYEGMAKWVEIQYLYLIGETAVARREEAITRSRQDEYGVGFCLYEDQYPLSREAMFCENTPFTTDRYPLE